MTKIDKFKKFVSNNPELINYIKNNNVTWQTLYEIYDLYGEDKSIWNKYIDNSSDILNIKGLLSTIKNINLDSLEENISSIQKAVSLVEELTKKDDKVEEKIVKEDKIDNIYGDK